MGKVRERVKGKEMVVFESDKTGHFTADSVQNYENSLHEHISDDDKIDTKKVKVIERKCNHHIKQFNRMFKVGATWGHEGRVANATTSTNVPPPPVYGLRKDHKNLPHPVRPVCGATQSPNSRLRNFLSQIINNFMDCSDCETECRSGEEMRAAFEAFNNLDDETRIKCKTISMDVKALYPSMSWNEIIIAVKEMILASTMDINNVDWAERLGSIWQ